MTACGTTVHGLCKPIYDKTNNKINIKFNNNFILITKCSLNCDCCKCKYGRHKLFNNINSVCEFRSVFRLYVTSLRVPTKMVYFDFPLKTFKEFQIGMY